MARSAPAVPSTTQVTSPRMKAKSAVLAAAAAGPSSWATAAKVVATATAKADQAHRRPKSTAAQATGAQATTRKAGPRPPQATAAIPQQTDRHEGHREDPVDGPDAAGPA